MTTRESSAPPAFPAAGGDLLLSGAAGAIELDCALPEAGVARAGVAIVCHPHPLQGGTMHNKVVTMLERALLELGLATVRFNFRGVGKSEGVHDNGRRREPTTWSRSPTGLRAVWPDDALWLGGFSFGSYVSLRAASRVASPRRLILDRAAGRTLGFQRVARADLPVADRAGRGRRDRRRQRRVRLGRQRCCPRRIWCACRTPDISSIAA